jgi:hypothetical protein
MACGAIVVTDVTADANVPSPLPGRITSEFAEAKRRSTCASPVSSAAMTLPRIVLVWTSTGVARPPLPSFSAMKIVVAVFAAMSTMPSSSKSAVARNSADRSRTEIDFQ